MVILVLGILSGCVRRKQIAYACCFSEAKLERRQLMWNASWLRVITRRTASKRLPLRKLTCGCRSVSY